MGICQIHPDTKCDCYAELYRSLELRKELEKFPKVLERSKISFWPKPFYWKEENEKKNHKRRGKVEVRPAVTEPIVFHPDLYKALEQPGCLQYQPTVSLAKRVQNMKVREELGERNPYCHPAEGLTHKMRATMELVGEASKKVEGALPLHERVGFSTRFRQKQVSIMKRILGPDGIFPVKMATFGAKAEKYTPPGEFDPEVLSDRQIMAREYMQTMKEIELVNITKRYRLAELNKIVKEMEDEEVEYNERKAKMIEEADHLEKLYLETKVESVLVDTDALQREKAERLRQVSTRYKSVRLAVFHLIETYEEYRKMQRFIYKLSPVEWREKNNVSELELYLNLSQEFFDDPDEMIEPDMLKKVLVKPLMYFTNPHHLVTMFLRLEDKLLDLILRTKELNNLRETFFKMYDRFNTKFECEVIFLQNKTEMLSNSIEWYEIRAKELKGIAQMYSYGEYQETVQELALKNVRGNVTSVYNEVITTQQTELSTVHMLAAIETRYATLVDELQFLPPRHRAYAAKSLWVDSKKREQLEKEEEQRYIDFKLLERRVKLAMSPTVVRKGKPLRPRSPPPFMASPRRRLSFEKAILAQEEMYYFT